MGIVPYWADALFILFQKVYSERRVQLDSPAIAAPVSPAELAEDAAVCALSEDPGQASREGPAHELLSALSTGKPTGRLPHSPVPGCKIKASNLGNLVSMGAQT